MIKALYFVALSIPLCSAMTVEDLQREIASLEKQHEEDLKTIEKLKISLNRKEAWWQEQYEKKTNELLQLSQPNLQDALRNLHMQLEQKK